MAHRRAGRIVLALLALVVVFGGGWFAGRAVLLDPETGNTTAPEVTLADVVESDVGRSVTFAVTVRQPFRAVASNSLQGVVTASIGQAELNVGDQAFAVAGAPVRVVIGDTPFYRDLTRGIRGDDVAQLQAALVALGYQTSAADGVFGASTESAVRSWQRAAGVGVTGTIRLGELIAVPTLPASVRVGEEIAVGAILAGGEEALSVPTGLIEFEMVLSSEQTALIPSDAAVTVEFDDAVWPAVIGNQGTNDQGQTVLQLTAPDGGSVCGTECNTLPNQESLSLTGIVQVTPSVSGPGVPAAAVRTDSAGATYVILADGERIEVSVLGSTGGVAVLDGVEIGQQVQLPTPGDGESSGDASG